MNWWEETGNKVCGHFAPGRKDNDMEVIVTLLLCIVVAVANKRIDEFLAQ